MWEGLTEEFGGWVIDEYTPYLAIERRASQQFLINVTP